MSSSWRNGNIFRIYLKDFLTYDEITFYPKPHLNVIIGPNGTGKSSILCAICLGLAGNPEVTGRGKQVLEYIKHGKKAAIIELELYHEKGNLIIKRCFSPNISKNNADNKWYLQGHLVTLQKIKDSAAVLGIQVNNLCQFLPQDRVIEFAKLNKVQLLQSTERAIGEKELADHHDVLCENGKTVLEKEAKLEDVLKQLNNEILKNDKVKDQVQNIKNGENLESSITNLKKVISFKKYTTAYLKWLECKKQTDEVKEAYESSLNDNAPKQKELDNIYNKITKLNSFLEKQTNVSRSLGQQAQTLTTEWVSVVEKIQDAQEEYRICENQHERLKNEIIDYKRQLEALKGQVADLQKVDENALIHEIKTLTSKIHLASQEYTDLQNSTTGYEQQCFQIDEEMRKTLFEKSKCQDVHQQRLNLLNQVNHGKFNQRQNQCKQIYNATVEFLHKHKTNFKGKVFDPLFTNIDLINQNFAKYIENTISNRDMIAFVCEEKDDVDMLKKECDRKCWSVNVLHSPSVHPDNFPPNIPIEDIKRFGFEVYLKDVIKAPNAIISYLCRNFNINNIPVSTLDRLPVEFDSLPDGIGLFFYGDNRVSIKRSIYDHKKSFNLSRINRPYLLIISNNVEKIKHIEEKIMELTERGQHLKRTLEQQKLQLQEKNSNLEILRSLKNATLIKKNQRLQLEENYRSKDALIKRKEASIPDLNVAAQKMQETIADAVNSLASITEKHANIEAKLAIICQSCIETNLKINKERQNLADLESDMKENSENLEKLMKQVSEKETEVRISKEQSKSLLEELYDLLGLQVPNHIPSEVQQQLKKDSKEDLDVLERRLAEKEVSKDCLVSADEKIVDEYEKRDVLIGKLRKDIDFTRKSIQKEKDMVAKCKRNWLPQVTDLISRINQHFSDFMSRLGCAGEVHLEKGDNENDFSKYGLAIKVKFRDNEKLKDLTAHQQSGGERSVSTALYLLALQTLTAVPFRCLDEINQGMDPTNERNMFTMLVETTTTETASQYFLVTPKLLPDLPHNSRVNFIVVYNGSKLHKPKYISVKKNILQLKKKKEKRNAISRQRAT